MAPFEPTTDSLQNWPIHSSPIHYMEDERTNRLEQSNRVVPLRLHSKGQRKPQSPPPLQRTRSLMVQPIHSVVGGFLRGAEATIKTLQTPMAAGPLASDTLLEDDEAEQLEDAAWLLSHGCRAAAGWNDGRAPHGGTLRIAMGLPPIMLQRGNLVQQTRKALDQAALKPGILELGLTEEAICEEAPETLLSLSALRDLGVGLALDRFAGSIDGLRALKRVPLTTLKLDANFTSDLEENRETRLTVEAIIKFAHAQETRVVAMGVKSALQRDILAGLRCDDAQGPLFGKPLSAGIFGGALLCLEPGWD